ncbi:MAG: hypothetical protein CL608_28860 [Anaerolineaceae bacterium]|nr:hypothetical protein [Anaerolineaceae bacterium]
MSEKNLRTMDVDKFQLLADEFIDRASQDLGEMPASIFFELPFDKMAESVTETTEAKGEIIITQPE